MNGFDGEDAGSALDGLTSQMGRLDQVTQQFGRSLSRSLASGIAQGRSLEDVLRNVGQRLIEIALRSAFRPIENAIGGGISSLLRGVTGLVTGSLGGGFAGPVSAFAEGGVINAPLAFPLGRGLGLAGERGAEAILPLSRGPDGRLGIAAAGGGAVLVTMNITTPDAESFRRAEAQVSAALARAVARGRRNL